MTDPRKPAFDAIRQIAATAGKPNPFNDAGNVVALHNIMDAWSLPREAVALVRAQVGLSAEDFDRAAQALGCTVAQIRAVDEVESGGGWFMDVRADILALDGPGGFIDGPNLPKILFEAHVFDRFTGGKFRTSHPNLSSAKWNRALYVGGQAEWQRLYRAMQLDWSAALKSASVGRYQIMGFNYALAGFNTVSAFWDAMKTSEAAQLDAFVQFIINSKLGAALRQISNVHADNIPFAKGYNGEGYAANSYQVKIARAHAKYARTPL